MTTYIIQETNPNDAGYLRCEGQRFDESLLSAGRYFFSYTKVNCDELTEEQANAAVAFLAPRHPNSTFQIIEKAS